jgi:hypothetical protein
VFLLKNIPKDLAGFSSLVEKGFPGYFLCSCAWWNGSYPCSGSCFSVEIMAPIPLESFPCC